MLQTEINCVRKVVSTVARTCALILSMSSSVALADASPPQTTPNAIELNLLVYNTHGLPAIFARDKPHERFPQIGDLTTTFDLSMLQEDFAHHELLNRYVDRSAQVQRGETQATPKCFVCSGSGLTFVSNLSPQRWLARMTFEPFEKCSGWLSRANDCFAQKGFQLIELSSKSGHRIFLVNTHLDAGGDQRDRDVRAAQLEQIANAMETYAESAAVILAGDLNLAWENRADRSLLQKFANRLDLTLAQKGGDAGNDWQTLDYIYYRSGDDAVLLKADSGEVDALTVDLKPLSDHPALYAKIFVE